MENEETDLDAALDLWKENRHNEAVNKIDVYISAQEDDEDRAEGLIHKGWITEDDNNHEESLASFEEALSLTGDEFLTAYALHGKGSVLLSTEKNEAAEACLEEAVSLYGELLADDDEIEEHYWGCVWLYLSILLAEHRHDELDEKVKSACASFKAPAWFLCLLNTTRGNYYYKIQKYNDCIPFFRKALKFSEEQNETFGENCYHLGSALYETGSEEEGQKIISKGLKLIKDDDMKCGALMYLDA